MKQHSLPNSRFARLGCITWWLVCLLSLSGSRCETHVDSCAFSHERRNRLGTIIALSRNIIVDSENPGNFDGDNGRFKRPDATRGYVTYTSERGFERVNVTGYVFEDLPPNSWSLSIRVSGTDSTADNTFEILTMTQEDLDTYRIEGGANGWQKFEIVLAVNDTCPPRMTVVINGPATNNEYPGWGVQLARVALVQSWFDGCTMPCEFDETPCSTDHSFRQVLDLADNFRNVYSTTSNVEIDTSDSDNYFEGDRGRFKRSNNRTGDLIYASTQSIQDVKIEIYQYKGFTPDIVVMPHVSKSCKPIKLTPIYTKSSTSIPGGWSHSVAHVDLRSLPLCTKRLVIRVSGGQFGWETQISRVTFSLAGTFEANPNSAIRSQESSSDGGGGGGASSSWWIWLTALLGSAFVFLMLAMIIRRVALCFGNDETSIYHISNFPYFRQRRNQTPPGLPNTPTIRVQQESSRPQRRGEASFSFAELPQNKA